ncbi:MAG: HlyD family secretion protein [Xanthomonadales bacterium]|nr:HlyD family secretion protein [Xanthomonadales bacterium]
MNDTAPVNDNAKPPAPKKTAPDPVRRWTFIVLALVLVLLAVYLRADRVTPYTSQARLHAQVVPIAAEVSGTVVSVHVQKDQVVEAGQVLFQIERDSYELAVSNAEGALAAARDALGASESTVEAARAQLAAAEAGLTRARQDAERMRAIKEEDPGAISDRRVESAEASLSVARSDVNAAQANLQKAIAALGGQGDDNATVQQALAALDQARLNLERTTVRAPSDGVVTDVRVDKGNFAGAGQPQMTFISTADAWVRADLTENNLGHVNPGDPVELVFDVFPGQVMEGRVREIGFGVEVDKAPLGSLPTIQNDQAWLRSAQRYPVLVEFELPDEADRRLLKVGSQASVVVYTDDHAVFNLLARIYIRVVSLLTYAY